VATVEEFIRQSGVRSIDELHLVDERERQWWPEGEGLDPKKVSVLPPHFLSLRSSFVLHFLSLRSSFVLPRFASELLTGPGVLLAGSGTQAPRGRQGQGQHQGRRCL
jgi:hypothetical protein